MQIDERTFKRLPSHLKGLFAKMPNPSSDEVMEAFAVSGERGDNPRIGPRSAKASGILGDFQGQTAARKDVGDTGTAARFFYAAKSSARERWVMLKCNCQTSIIPAWQRQDRSRSVPTVITSPARDTCEGDSTDETGLFTSLSGSERTALSRLDGKSTTRTKTSKTTGSTTSKPLVQPSINGFTPVANCGRESGGSHAQSAESSSQSLRNTGTSRKRDGRSTVDADHATLPASSRKNVCERCGSQVVETAHPTVKPLALMEWLVKLVTPKGGLVLDPFGGSGTTGKAAANVGRRAVLVEREAAYSDIARRRVAEAMGTGLLAGIV